MHVRMYRNIYSHFSPVKAKKITLYNLTLSYLFPYRSLGNLVAVQSPRVPKLGMFVGPPELPTGYRARTQEDKGKL